jgi:diamine N-acetyltransferase
VPKISIREVNLDNLRDVVRLKVAENQANFVADNTQSIAWSRYVPNLRPSAIYDDDTDTPVGFALYGSWGDEKPGLWGIARFMIGEQYQGKGYGKAAMEEIARLIKEEDPGVKGIVLSLVPGNDGAHALYERVGFHETGEIWDDQIEMRYDYPPSAEGDRNPAEAPAREAPEVSIRELTAETWRDAADLRVADDQVEFVAPNAYSIALSKYHPNFISAGIYDADTLVGFVLYGERTSRPGEWGIARFMIDQHFQGKGYGRAGLREVLRLIKQQAPNCPTVTLSYEPHNDVARRLYASEGFVETGEVIHGEIVAELDLQAWQSASTA